jgi:hypothetical protein
MERQNELDWNSLVVPITQDEIRGHVVDPTWQSLRIQMKYCALDIRFDTLKGWLALNKNSRASQVQVANYVNALKRGGMVK